MRGRFIGNPANGGEGAEQIVFFGVTFPYGEWIEVNPTVASRLAGNTHFEFQTDAEVAAVEEAEVKARPGKKGKAAAPEPVEGEVAPDAGDEE